MHTTQVKLKFNLLIVQAIKLMALLCEYDFFFKINKISQQL